VITATYGGQFKIYENTVGAGTDRLQFRAVDENGSTALGATVSVSGAKDHRIVQHDETDYLSQESRVGHVGLRSDANVTITVTWPDGTERTFEDVAPNQGGDGETLDDVLVADEDGLGLLADGLVDGRGVTHRLHVPHAGV